MSSSIVFECLCYSKKKYIGVWGKAKPSLMLCLASAPSVYILQRICCGIRVGYASLDISKWLVYCILGQATISDRD